MAIDLRSKKGIAIVVGIALATGALAFGIGYAVSRGVVKAAEEKARLAEEATSTDTPTTTVPATSAPEPTASVEPTVVPPVTGDTPSSDTGIEDGKFFTFIEKVTVKSGVSYLTADYAQMLTGDAAAKAAKAAGDESPPPNDYYIINVNEKLRKLPVTSGVKVTLATWEMHFAVEGYPVAFGTWSDMINGKNHDFPRATMVPYWVTIKGGKVTKIAEQYLP